LRQLDRIVVPVGQGDSATLVKASRLGEGILENTTHLCNEVEITLEGKVDDMRDTLELGRVDLIIVYLAEKMV
jgi:hypothetical protein